MQLEWVVDGGAKDNKNKEQKQGHNAATTVQSIIWRILNHTWIATLDYSTCSTWLDSSHI